MVLGDTLTANFDRLFTEALGRADVVIRSSTTLTTDGESAQGLIDGGIVAELSALPGVSQVAPQIEGFGQLTGADGEKLGGEGPPTLAGNWIDDADLNPYELAEGRAPRDDRGGRDQPWRGRRTAIWRSATLRSSRRPIRSR